MDQTNDIDYQQEEDILLPGFRFHPTDEELVGFYLRRKVQQKPLCIELIKQLDIYKFDPWDLPKMSNMGEKEWYFYCTRDRKYPNSNRPNRVTGAGFWKATGIDKPIYSSITKGIIGLKKSLVFYKGRAAKGFKTEWMMHEFRLPASPNASNNVQAHNDSWTICRVFKKSTFAQRTLQHRRSLCIPSGNSIPVNSVREELPSNETGIQTSSSSNLCNSSLTNDQCCSCESYPPQMIGYSKINQNSGDHDMHLTEKSKSFQNQEMSQKYFNHDQMSHFSTNSMQVQVSPRIADVTDYRPPWLDHKIHQLNFSYDHHQQTTTSGSYTDPADADFLKNINNRLGQGSSSQDYIFGLNYLMS